MKTQVGIIGAGPAGLLLGHLLRAEGIEAVVIERQSCDHVLSRIRAGVLERTTTDLLRRLGIDEGLNARGMMHRRLIIADRDTVIPIDLDELVNSYVTVYGQTEVTRDLVEAAGSRGLPIIWESPVRAVEAIDGPAPVIHHDDGGRLACDVVVGCDGFHGIGRSLIPSSALRMWEMAYPFGWLGILADVPPCHDEVIYAAHEDGFALASMRSPARSRYYVQVPADEKLENWSDDRFWEELIRRLGPAPIRPVVTGPSIEKSIAPLRSFVAEPMRHGRLFLAGDAAHIVPPTGAKGLNLAASDVTYLAEALIAWFRHGDEAALEAYPRRALARIWKTERFSWHMTRLLHRFPDDAPFDQRMKRAELELLAGSRLMRASIAESYVGLPL